jgi:predicted AlkP superfamily phosphohydrolase/phosphomutase
MKALIVGLDSASPYLIKKWINDLPNLKSLFAKGINGTLRSIVPPESVPAWQCFATGKNPAKIGVYGFAYIGRDLQLRHGRTTPEQGSFWDLCSANGMKVGVFNVPGTFPPYPINGFMVSGFPVPPRKVWAYPKDLMRLLNRAVGTYEVDVPLAKPTEMRGGEDEFLAQVERLHTKSLEAAKFLIQAYLPDVFVMTFQAIDRVHHDFWKYLDEEDSQYRNVLHDWYQKVDAAVGELYRLAGPETHVLALSDHGSAAVSSAFYINEYLERSGLLTLNSRIRKKGANYAKLRKTMLRIVPPSFIARAYKITPGFISRNFTGFATIDRILEGIIDNVDWEKTLAYSTGGHQAHIYVNYKVVKKTSSQEDLWDVSSVVAKLCDLMDQLTDAKTGEKLRPVFHFKDIAFKGPYQDEAPDLCVELYTEKDKVQVNPRVGTKQLWSFSPHYSSIHTREGFWALTGPQIKERVEMNASILDMAPTLLRLLHVETNTDFDGKVLDFVFNSPEGSDRPRIVTSTDPVGTPMISEATAQ